MSYPKVAIIILNYNGWKDTIECLESVLRNDYPNYQVIVVDNGSPNNSMKYIKAWAEGRQEVLTPEPTHPLYHLSHPPVKKPIPYIEYNKKEAEKGGTPKLENSLMIKWLNSKAHLQDNSPNNSVNPTTKYPLILIQTGSNLGYAGGNNVGIRYAQKRDFEYIWLLNNDVVIDKDALTELLKLAESDKKIGIVGSKLLYYYYPNTIQTLGGSDQITWKNFGKYIYPFEEDRIEFNKSFEIKGYICGASLLIKKEVITTIGIFDKNYFIWAEEADLCFRAAKKGWKLFYCGKSRVWHKIGASSGASIEKVFMGRRSKRASLSRFVITGYYDIRNWLYFVQKYFDNKYFITACLYSFFRILRQISGIILYDDYKLSRIKLLLKAFYDGIKGNGGKTIDPSTYK